MRKWPKGAAVLSFTLVILLLCLSLSVASTRNVLSDTQALVHHAQYDDIKANLTSYLARQVAIVLQTHSPLAVQNEVTANTVFEMQLVYQAQSASSFYDGVYQLKASANNAARQTVITSQSLALGEIALFDRIPSHSFVSYAPNQQDNINALLSLKNRNVEHLLKRFAHSYDDKCNALNTFSSGIIFIEGACHLSAVALGSVSEPVVLVVKNGDLVLSAASNIHGVVLHLCDLQHASSTKASSALSSKIHGALITTCDDKLPQANVMYRPDILVNWMAHKNNQAIEVVSGSWHYE